MKFCLKKDDDQKVRFELQESGGTIYLKAYYDAGGYEDYAYVCSFDPSDGKLAMHYLPSDSPLTRDNHTGCIATK